MSESGIRKLFTGISAIFGGKKPSRAEMQDSVEDIDRLIEESKKFQDAKQIDRAIPLLARAIVQERARVGVTKHRALDLQYNLVELNTALSRFAEAESTLRQCLTDEQDYTFSNSPSALNNPSLLKRNTIYVDQGKSHGVIRAELRLLDLYARSRQNDPARIRCLQILERYRLAEDPAGRVWFSGTYATPLLRRMGMLEEALELQREVVAWAESHPEENPANIPDRLNTLAELYEALDRYAEALEVFGRVLKIREQEFKPDETIHVDAFAAGVSASYNPSQQDRDAAFLNYNRCLSRLNPPSQDAPSS